MNIEKVIDRLSIAVAISKFETKDYSNCIVMKQDLRTLLTAYEKEKGENVKLRLQDIPLIEGELRAYKDRVNELKQEIEKEKEENMSYYYHIQGLEDDIRMHYISTYKIEKEIKKIKDSNTYGYVGEEWNDRDVVELLENLISKEE